ncbi:MAG: tetratricopeptide repeat protein [Spirochaetes bacterium]|nr:tetratricopeptide repeat protein [Spirochaetota bacterium]
MKKLIFVFIFLFSVNLFAKQTVVGVSAFKNLAHNKDYDWLETGIAESVSYKLRNVQSYIVVDRVNVDKLMNEIALSQSGLVDEESAKQAGKALGADIIVLGSFQYFGDQIRISAKLVETESHKVLNQVLVTGQMKDIFSLQDDVALKIISNTSADVTEKEINKIKARYTEDISAYKYYVQGQKYNLETLDYLKAIEMFNKAISIDKNYSLAYAGLSSAYSLRSWELRTYENRTDKSLLQKSYEYAQKALKLNPELGEVYVSLARYYQEADEKVIKNKWTLCEENARKAIKINPNNSEAYFVLSRVFGYDDAKEEEYLKISLSKNPAFVDAHNNMGVLLLDQDRYADAEKSFKRATEIDPGFKTAYMNLGVTYDRQGKKAEALELYKTVVEKYPNYPKGLLNLAIGYRNIKDYDNAFKIIERLIKTRENLADAYGEYGYIYLQKKDYPKSIKNYQTSLKYDASNKYSLVNIAQAYYDSGDYNNSFTYYSKCLRLYPDYESAATGMVNTTIQFRDKKDYPNAVKSAQVLIELKVKLSEAYFELGYIALQQSDYVNAEKNFRTSLDNNSTNVYSLSNLAYVYYQQQNYTDSEKYSQQLLKIEPNDAYITNMMGLIQYYHYKNYAKSKEYFEKASRLEPDNSTYRENIKFADNMLKK